MTVGELRELLVQLGTCDIPDDAPVLIDSRYSFHTTKAEVMCIHPINQYGQAHFAPNGSPQQALVFLDTSAG